MQAQIKVQNPGKMFGVVAVFFYFKYTGYGKRHNLIFHLQRTQFKVLFLFPISYKDEGLKQWCGYHQLYLQW